MNYQDNQQNRAEQGSALESENQQPSGGNPASAGIGGENEQENFSENEETGEERENLILGEDEYDIKEGENDLEEEDDLTDDEDGLIADEDDMMEDEGTEELDDDRRDNTII